MFKKWVPFSPKSEEATVSKDSLLVKRPSTAPARPGSFVGRLEIGQGMGGKDVSVKLLLDKYSLS